MPWLKVSDRFATHPALLRLRSSPRADDRTMNEVIGFITRCSAQSACYLTDYFIELGTAELIGGARTELLLKQAAAAGLVIAEGRGASRRWRIVEDEDLFHVRAREDVEWERQRDRDRRDVDLTMPVLARDGDQCRYCRAVVNWKDTRSGRGGTFDHREPGKAATVETYVVSCRRCNSKRRANPHADEELPLLPAPPAPYFSPKSQTAARLAEFYGRPFVSAQQLRPDADPAPARPGTQPVPAAPSRPAPDHARTVTPAAAEPTTEVPPWSEGGRPDGTGRDGPGWAGPGASTPASPATPPTPKRRARGRRGRSHD